MLRSSRSPSFLSSRASPWAYIFYWIESLIIYFKCRTNSTASTRSRWSPTSCSTSFPPSPLTTTSNIWIVSLQAALINKVLRTPTSTTRSNSTKATWRPVSNRKCSKKFLKNRPKNRKKSRSRYLPATVYKVAL